MPAPLPPSSRARGLVLGLLLGDAVGEQSPGASGPLLATTAGQLVCWVLDGLIRAHVRGAHKGIAHPPSMVWLAYHRWAHLQQVPGVPDLGDASGWLADLAPLRRRAGTAPATVAALRGGRMGTPEHPAGASEGFHALTSAAPAALFDYPDSGRQIAALTHAGAAQEAAAAGVRLLRDALMVGLPGGPASLSDGVAPVGVDGPPGTAGYALRHGSAAARDVPGDVAGALETARRAGPGAAAVAGALLGASLGAAALPQRLLARLELATTGDSLARDAVRQQRDHPSGTEHRPEPDGWWLRRYPA